VALSWTRAARSDNLQTHRGLTHRHDAPPPPTPVWTGPERRNRVRRFFSRLGPGLITGAADDDPSGISTYSVAGALFGYGALWTALFSFPLMASV
jgi:hypothetical protein